MKNSKIYVVLVFLVAVGAIQAGNPLVPINMADPHVHIFNGKVYMYTTRDEVPSKGWNMPDWQIWTSEDLVNWKKILTISPTETYIGESHLCFASDAATRNGKYYFYFSNYTKDSGVMVADAPEGPYVDALGKPLLPSDLTPTSEYDISVPVDDDGYGYIIFGVNNNRNKVYHIAKLNPDMISLAEQPKPIKITGQMRGSDKPNVHKHNGRYYLTVGANYAISDNIYGPYSARRSCEDDSHPYGWNQRAHGNFFDWNNQSFYVWCRFQFGNKEIKRDSHMTYVHYKENGDMVYDEELLANHYETGVGQYSASWDTIQAEWYMAADKIKKVEKSDGGFSVRCVQNGGSLYFPNIDDIAENSSITFHVATPNSGGKIEVYENDAKGRLLGACDVPQTGGWEKYQDITCKLTNATGKKNIYLKFVGNKPVDLDWISVSPSAP